MTPRELLSALMARAGDNPNSLSRQSKVPQPTLFRLLSGEAKEPRRSTLEPLARYYRVPVEAFFDSKIAAAVLADVDDAAGPAKELRAKLSSATDQIAVWDNPDELPEDEDRLWIDRYDLKCSAGAGVVQWEIRQKRALPFTSDFFKAIGARPEACRLAEARGDSMEPYLFNRDMIMIDTDRTVPRDGQIYAVCFEGETLVKQVFKQAGGSLTLHSLNSMYPDRVVAGDEHTSFEVLGEIIYRSGAGLAG